MNQTAEPKTAGPLKTAVMVRKTVETIEFCLWPLDNLTVAGVELACTQKTIRFLADLIDSFLIKRR